MSAGSAVNADQAALEKRVAFAEGVCRFVASTKGEFSLTLSGKTYTFKLGTAALIELQEMWSTPERTESIEEILFNVQIGRLKYIRSFLWAGLQKHHPNTTMDQVDDLLDEASEEEVKALLADLGLSMQPDPKDAKELIGSKRPRTAPGRRTSGTGGNSATRPEA